MFSAVPPTGSTLPKTGARTSYKETSLMENMQEDLKAHLMQTDNEFRQLAARHTEYHRLLETIESKERLTPQDEVEEHRLKKLKLHCKDQMNQIIKRYKVQQVQ
jgi:uncharacterized protein YdcH (DUF465 family)